MVNFNKGWHHSEEAKNKMRLSKKGKPLTEEWKKKVSISLKGNKRRLGIKHTEETKKRIREALKGKSTLWNKGIKLSEEHKQKISKKLKGRNLSEETRKKMSLSKKGKVGLWIGKKHSEETKKKISELAKLNGFGKWWKGKKHKKESRKKMALAQTREKHWNWKNGITNDNVRIRKSLKYIQWRQQVFIRDNFVCQKCYTKGGYLEVHHKKSFCEYMKEIKLNLPLLGMYEGAMVYEPFWDINNGITLCKKCHIKITKEGRK